MLPALQEAAGAFAALRDGPALHVEAPRPIDLSPECAAMLERLCLAQAQEAIFDKARADHKNPATLARCGHCHACAQALAFPLSACVACLCAVMAVSLVM